MTDELAVLRAARSGREALYTVHYACQNLNEVQDSPAAVSCVSFYDVNLGTAHAFGLANVGTASTKKEEREVLLLQAALKFMRDHSEARWLHWKMSRPEYGFQALADRYIWLEQSMLAPPPGDRCHDLESLISHRHGRDFAPHPRLPSLVHLNSLASRYARWGAEEPRLTAQGEYTAVQQSATEKVRLLANIFDLLVEGRLQTENSAGEVQFAGAHLDAVAVVLALGERFELVRRSLKRRHNSRDTLLVSDEYDAQDLVRSLLVQFFDDVRDEAWCPEYAGGASRIDFLLPQTRLAVELKWMRESLSAREVGEQLRIDRQKYQKHPDVGHLVCLVFDLGGLLPNPRGLEEDLRQAGRDDVVACTVRIIDR
jgi:REase_DpnII-MboI